MNTQCNILFDKTPSNTYYNTNNDDKDMIVFTHQRGRTVKATAKTITPFELASKECPAS